LDFDDEGIQVLIVDGDLNVSGLLRDRFCEEIESLVLVKGNINARDFFTFGSVMKTLPEYSITNSLKVTKTKSLASTLITSPLMESQNGSLRGNRYFWKTPPSQKKVNRHDLNK